MGNAFEVVKESVIKGIQSDRDHSAGPIYMSTIQHKGAILDQKYVEDENGFEEDVAWGELPSRCATAGVDGYPDDNDDDDDDHKYRFYGNKPGQLFRIKALTAAEYQKGGSAHRYCHSPVNDSAGDKAMVCYFHVELILWECCVIPCQGPVTVLK